MREKHNDENAQGSNSLGNACISEVCSNVLKSNQCELVKSENEHQHAQKNWMF